MKYLWIFPLVLAGTIAVPSTNLDTRTNYNDLSKRTVGPPIGSPSVGKCIVRISHSHPSLFVNSLTNLLSLVASRPNLYQEHGSHLRVWAWESVFCRLEHLRVYSCLRSVLVYLAAGSYKTTEIISDWLSSPSSHHGDISTLGPSFCSRSSLVY